MSTVRVRSRVLVTSSVALVQIVRSEIRLLSSSKVFFTGGVHAPALLSVVSTMYLVQPLEGATGVVCCWYLRTTTIKAGLQRSTVYTIGKPLPQVRVQVHCTSTCTIKTRTCTRYQVLSKIFEAFSTLLLLPKGVVIERTLNKRIDMSKARLYSILSKF